MPSDQINYTAHYSEFSLDGSHSANNKSLARCVERAALIARFYRLRKQRRASGCQATWRGRCPFHGGKSGTSFIVSVSETGKLLMYCHAGCSYSTLGEQVDADIGPFGTHDDAAVAALADAVAETRWRGRAAATDRAVMGGLVEIARRIGSLEIGASLLELAELAKIQQPQTVSRALTRLRAAGWIDRIERATVTRAAVYRLKAKPAVSVSDVASFGAPRYVEVFRRTGGGLGFAAGKVFVAILHEGPISARGIAELLGYRSPDSVREQAKKLIKHGLVQTISSCGDRQVVYVLGRKSEFELERELGMADETKRQRMQNDERREAYRRWQLGRRGRTKWTEAGEVINTDTGEILLDREGRMPNMRRRSDRHQIE
jgi:DNA-binding MarR family transcriptional regulator